MIIVLTVCLWFIAAQVAYFPGDVPVARFLQTIAPAGPQWAKVVTTTAEFPWFFITGHYLHARLELERTARRVSLSGKLRRYVAAG
jgi:hypothetical protein